MPLGLCKEQSLLKKYDLIVGVDEAGRGPIAGPVCCGAFTLISPSKINISDYPYSAIADSKQITEEDREDIYDEIIHIARTGHPLHKSKPVKTHKGSSEKDVTLDTAHLEDASHDTESTMASSEVETSSQEEALASTSTEGAMSSASTAEDTLDAQSAADTKSDVDDTDIPFTSESAFAFAMCKSEPTEIDTLNILNATLLSMARAVYKLIAALPAERLNLKVKVLVDGNRMPPHMTGKPQASPIPSGISEEEWRRALSKVEDIQAETIIKGDSSVFSIAAASIIAKVSRDRLLRRLARLYPEYELEGHKGYPTPAHKALVNRIGPSDIHRLSFEPCYTLLKNKVFQVPTGRDFKTIQELKEVKKGKRSKDKASLDASQPKLKLVKRAS